MANGRDITTVKPEFVFQFRLSRLFAAMTWISVWFAVIKWYDMSYPVGVCLGVLVLAIYNDRYLNNFMRLAIALPILGFLVWFLTPTIY